MKHQKTCISVSRAHLYVLEHVRMVADLLQLHDGVHQSLSSAFALKKIKILLPFVVNLAKLTVTITSSNWISAGSI